MKTETCLTQPKYLLIAILIQLSAPPPILITVHVDYVQSYQATYFYHLSFSWISGGFMQFWLNHLKGCVGKSPTKWHLISSPILLLLEEAKSNLLGESCCLSDVTLRLFYMQPFIILFMPHAKKTTMSLGAHWNASFYTEERSQLWTLIALGLHACMNHCT